jgi:hypothetical protein
LRGGEASPAPVWPLVALAQPFIANGIDRALRTRIMTGNRDSQTYPRLQNELY